MKNTLNTQDKIEYLLQDIGFPTNLKGYSYITRSLLLISEDESLLSSTSSKLYPAIAEEYHTTTSAVERAIRHAISTTWLRGNLSLQHELFRYTIDPLKGKPTNTEFLSLIYYEIRREFL